MKDRKLQLALGLEGLSELVKALEDIESKKVDAIMVCESVGFADERDLHDRVCLYVRSLGAKVILVPDGKPFRHPLPWDDSNEK